MDKIFKVKTKNFSVSFGLLFFKLVLFYTVKKTSYARNFAAMNPWIKDSGLYRLQKIHIEDVL